MGDTFGDTFGVFSQVQMILHKLLLKIRRRLKIPMKTNKSFICFEMLEEGWKFEKLFFGVFSSRKQGNKYVQNILLIPFTLTSCASCW